MGRWDEAERNWNMIRGMVMTSHADSRTKRELLSFLESVENHGYEPRPENEDERTDG